MFRCSCPRSGQASSGTGLFGDVIHEIDWSMGQIMQALEETGQAANTLVLFTSDNGPWLSYGNHAGSAGPLRKARVRPSKGASGCRFWPGGLAHLSLALKSVPPR